MNVAFETCIPSAAMFLLLGSKPCTPKPTVKAVWIAAPDTLNSKYVLAWSGMAVFP